MKITDYDLDSLSRFKSSYLIPIECDFCSQEILRQVKVVKSNVKYGRKHCFCNQTCKHSFTTAKANWIIRQCEKCGNDVKRRQKEFDRGGATFCSHSCRASITNKIRKRERKAKPIVMGKRVKSRDSKMSVTKPRAIKLDIGCICYCAHCHTTMRKTKRELAKSKGSKKLSFCSKSCRMTHQNLTNPRVYECRRSKAEIYFVELLKKDFPSFTILENTRGVLPSRLEIDIYIPQVKLAIEINGPFHYLPIHGCEKLKRRKELDAIKFEDCKALGLTLLILDISDLQSDKKTRERITDFYSTQIRKRLVV